MQLQHSRRRTLVQHVHEVFIEGLEIVGFVLLIIQVDGGQGGMEKSVRVLVLQDGGNHGQRHIVGKDRPGAAARPQGHFGGQQGLTVIGVNSTHILKGVTQPGNQIKLLKKVEQIAHLDAVGGAKALTGAAGPYTTQQGYDRFRFLMN